MDVTFEEKLGSPQIRDGRNPSVTTRWLVFGAEDELAAKALLYESTPEAFDLYGSALVLIPRENVTVTPVTPPTAVLQVYDCEVTYGKTGSQRVIAFDTGGGTQHITNSLETTGRYGANPPDFHGAIGVTLDGGIEGVDINVPVYQWTEQHELPADMVTQAYQLLLYSLTNTVNQYTFRGFPPGSVQFQGASGTQSGNGNYVVTFRFAASPNITDQTIGEITGINKKGWEYLWVLYKEIEDSVNKRVVRRPEAAYTERVFRWGDFQLMELPD